MLIEAGLITPLDLVDSSNLTDPTLNKKNAEKILKSLLSELNSFKNRSTWLDHHHYEELLNQNLVSEVNSNEETSRILAKLTEN